MSNAQRTGDDYERVAKFVLNELASVLGLKSIEDKQDLPGESGTSWEADLVAYDQDGGMLKIECKYRSTKSGAVKQAEMGAFALSITDTKAVGGILVSPHPVQSGAEKIADHYNIRLVKISSGSTEEKYIAQIKNAFYVGVTESMQMMDSISIKVEINATANSCTEDDLNRYVDTLFRIKSSGDSTTEVIIHDQDLREFVESKVEERLKNKDQ